MAGFKKGWYSRQEVERVTLDWIKVNCRITDREMELLKIIKDRKLVRRDMLEIISPSYRCLGNNRTEILNRAIRKLFRKMCIDKVHEERELGRGGNYPCTIALDKGGSLLLGVPHKRRILHHKEGNYIRRSLPANYRHINGVNQLEVDTILFCEKTDSNISVWVHEKPQELYYGQDKVVVIPDVVMGLKFNTGQSEPFYAFIEYDTGSESLRYKEPPIIRDKVIKYKKYKLSKLWENDYPYFPVLLLVTEDQNRIDFFNKKCEENNIKGVGIYSENYTAFLERLSQIV
jgi:Replication-relaxation